MTSHQERLNIHTIDPKATKAVMALESYVSNSGIDRKLYELIKIRASQLNRCAFCLDMHTADAIKNGEDQRRINILAGWNEAPQFFTEQEQAALALTEAVTRIGDHGVPEEIWAAASAAFNETELVHVIMAINVINVWNRMAVTTHQRLPESP